MERTLQAPHSVDGSHKRRQAWPTVLLLVGEKELQKLISTLPNKRINVASRIEKLNQHFKANRRNKPTAPRSCSSCSTPKCTSPISRLNAGSRRFLLRNWFVFWEIDLCFGKLICALGNWFVFWEIVLCFGKLICDWPFWATVLLTFPSPWTMQSSFWL